MRGHCLPTPAVQISAFWDAGLEPVDVAMSDLVPAAHPCAEAVAVAVAHRYSPPFGMLRFHALLAMAAGPRLAALL